MGFKAVHAAVLTAALNSFVLDYVARQSVGGTHLNFFILKQLPVPNPESFYEPCPWDRSCSKTAWLLPRVLELLFTAHDLQPFALDLGYDGPPFAWEEERRFILRAELDAAFFHIYGIASEDVDYIMDTFHIVRENDLKAYGRYRTKETILEIYDDMASAMQETSAPQHYPATEDERLHVALAYAVVRQAAGATDQDVLGAVLRAQHPDLSRHLLSREDQSRWEAVASAGCRRLPSMLPNWPDCQEYLEDLEAVRVERGGSVNRLFLEGGLPRGLAQLADELAPHAEMGLLALRQARKGLEGTQGRDARFDELLALAMQGSK